MTKQVTVSEATKHGDVIYFQRCLFFTEKTRYCTIGQGNCVHLGDDERCTMFNYYASKLYLVPHRKTFDERFKRDFQE